MTDFLASVVSVDRALPHRFELDRQTQPPVETSVDRSCLRVSKTTTETEKMAEKKPGGGGDVRWMNLFRSWVFPSLGGLLYGYDIGAMAMALGDLTSSRYSGTTWWKILENPTMAGVVVAMVTWGAMVGSVVVFYIEARLGRRREMLVSSCCYGAGAAMVASVGKAWSPGIAVMWICVGRGIYGVGVGLAMHGVPSYIAETAPSSFRGALVSGKEAMIVLGMLLGYGVGAAFQTTRNGWRFVFLLAVPVTFVYGIGVAALPPSPRWLALRGASPGTISAAAKFVLINS